MERNIQLISAKGDQKSMIDYKDFLESKKLRVVPSGFEVSLDRISPVLFDFQRDIVHWALKKGKACIFAGTGLGKTLMQLEWACHVYKHTGRDILILAPLAVASQTAKEGEKLKYKVNICRTHEDVKPGINITNYEMMDHFDASMFGAVVLDESSILKSYNGKIRTAIIQKFNQVPFRLACTATPSPNDFSELGNHAEFLGVMARPDMLATFFVHDSKPDNHDGEGFRSEQKWRLKGHATKGFWSWVASWAVMMQRPSDLGYEDNGFKLKDLNFHQIVTGKSAFGEARTIQERIQARSDNVDDKVIETVRLINEHPEDKWLIWCGLNKESDALHRAIKGSYEIKGSDPIDKKSDTLLGFANGSVQLLVSKASICGFGMNFQKCHRMIFVGLSDSFEEMYQAIRRCWRFGQPESVEVYIITSEAEGAVVRNVKAKEKRFNEMIEGMISATQEINKANLKKTIREYDKYEPLTIKGNGWEMRLGDAVEELPTLKDESVGYSIFSPPFQNIFVYSNSDRDVGNCRDKETFKKHMGFIAKELYRILMSGRLLSIHCSDLPAFKYKEGYIGLRDFPAMCREIFEEVGFIYHSKVTIYKSPVTEMYRTKTQGLLYKQLKKDSSKVRQGLADYIVTMMKPGDNLEPITHDESNFPLPMWQKYADPVWMDIITTNTLNNKSVREYEDEKHICPLQLDVIERCLELWSNPRDLVLSPFVGIGSEGYTAISMNRRFIGVELKKSYFEQACDYLEQAAKTKVGSKQAKLFISDEMNRGKQKALYSFE